MHKIMMRAEASKNRGLRWPAALKELRDVAATVAGAVLNQVDMRRHARYGYGDAGQYYGTYRRYYIN